MASKVHEPIAIARAGAGEVGDDLGGVVVTATAIRGAGAIVVRGVRVVVVGRRIGTTGHFVFIAESISICVRAGGVVNNHTDVVDVELLPGHTQLLDIAADDDLAGNEAAVVVEIDLNRRASEDKPSHSIDLAKGETAVDQ